MRTHAWNTLYPQKGGGDIGTSCTQALRAFVMTRRPPWMNADLDDLRDLARTFCEKEIKPHIETFIADKHVDRQLWNRAGEVGLLCLSIPEEYGGGG